jgi:hypothetical protein
MKYLLSLCIICCLAYPVDAKHKRKEREYQADWCSQYQGQIEVRMPDGTRCDCLLPNYAIEFDFAQKWAEAIGQSLYYASQTQRLPGIVLIIEQESEYTYVLRLSVALEYHGLGYVKVWLLENLEK